MVCSNWNKEHSYASFIDLPTVEFTLDNVVIRQVHLLCKSLVCFEYEKICVLFLGNLKSFLNRDIRACLN